jgi:hypothetical protein
MPKGKSPTGRQERSLPVLEPALQVAFWHRLQELRDLYLRPALSVAVGRVGVEPIDRELAAYVRRETLDRIARIHLRGEVFFPVPCLLHTRPALLGYYRLLYGFSQKEFYTHGPFGAFRVLEERDEIPRRLSERVSALCTSLVATGCALVEALTHPSLECAHELQLLTLGPQLRGSRNTNEGQAAMAGVFRFIRALVEPYATAADATTITLENDSGRTIDIRFGSVCDVRVTERRESGPRGILCIEIKGGRYAPGHRIAEAERSHQKAKALGFFEFWTVLRADVDLAKARAESPTTTRFFNLDEIQEAGNPQYTEFRDLLCLRLGIRPPATA